MSHFFVYDIYS